MLEDCHWIDELSRDLLEVLIRAATSLPVLFVLAYRPASEPGGGLGVEGNAGFTELALDRMDADDVAQLVRSKMQQLMGADSEVSDALVELVAARSEGNPFYVEELLNFIVSQGVDAGDPAAIETVRLPDSLHTLVLSRIDAAAEGPRRTMKVASVVGRVFEAPMLPGAYRELGDLDAVLAHLDVLRTLDLVALDREADQAWMFKHVVTQEVAYESLPFALRAVLHGLVGDYIERIEARDLDRVVPLLEHHFWRSDREGKKREYLWRAGQAAQASFANNAAIVYFQRLVPLLEGRERAQALLALGKVFDLVADWAGAETAAAEALELSETDGDVNGQAWAHAALAEIRRKQGEFESATAELDAAAEQFIATSDDAGLGQVWHLAGTVAAQRGDLELARRRYEDSLGVRERLGDLSKMGALYSNLAIVAEYSGDLPGTRQMAERALAIRTEANDRWGIGVSLGNLGAIAVKEGKLDEARARSEEALAVLSEVGDPWMLANTENNLGNAARDLRDFKAAGSAYASSLRRFASWDDRWALAILLEDVALLAAGAGDHRRAVTLAEAAGTLREEIGASQGDALKEELRTRLEPSVATLGASEVDAARADGRSLGLAGAVALALDVCGEGLPA